MQKPLQIFSSQRLPFKGQAFNVFVFITATGLLLPNLVFAQFDWFLNLIASLLLSIASLIGQLAILMIGLLVDIVQFNNFIDAPAVVKGWKIVRDVCNMFFIVILLLISFGSVFRIEEYQYKRILGKLLIMAVLINFSKMIAGFFIDIAQVIMLTFVNGFKEAASGNFINGFGIKEMFTLSTKSNTSGQAVQGLTSTEYLIAAALALATITITCVVVGVYLIVFLLRIIALWFLIIISPIAYALAAFPGEAKKYSSMWWDYFGKYASTGPILAFFLWLSLAVMQTSSTLGSDFKARESETGLSSIPSVGITQIGQSEVLLSFIINIMLLMGGLWMTQQLGVAGGKLAAAASNKIQNAGTAIAKSPLMAAKGLARSSYAQRLGYGGGIAVATAMAKMPVVGGLGAKWEGKLRKRRALRNQELTKDLAYVSEETAMKRAEMFHKKIKPIEEKKGWEKIKNFFPTIRKAIPLGEKSRARGLYMTQLASKTQDRLPKKAKELREQAELAGLEAKELKEKNKNIANNIVETDSRGNKYNYNELSAQLNLAQKERESAEEEEQMYSPNGKATQELNANLKHLSDIISHFKIIANDPGKSQTERNAAANQIAKAEAQILNLQSAYNSESQKVKNKADSARSTEQELRNLYNRAESRLPPDYKKNEDDIKNLENKEASLNKEARDIQVKFWDDLMNEVASQAKQKVTVENNDVYEDKDLGDFREQFLNTNPNLIPQDKPRVVTDKNTPALVNKKIFDEDEQRYRTRRIGVRALEDMSLANLSDTDLVMAHLADGIERLITSLKAQDLTIDKDGSVRDKETGRVITDDRQLFQIFKTAFQGLDSFRATQSPRKVGLMEEALGKLIDLMKTKASGGSVVGYEKIIDRITKFDSSIIYASLNNVFKIAATRSRLN